MKKIVMSLSVVALMFTVMPMQAAKLAMGNRGADSVAVDGGILFSHDAWADILKRAKSENKMIFMDCYTSWCGPCKVLAKTVFKDADVANLMNDKFINVKVDMEKGEGVDLKNRFEVKAFPTLLFFTPSGEVEHRIVGSVPANEFIREANVALSGKGLNSFIKKYKAGVRDTAFLKEYIKIVNASYLKEEAKAASMELITALGMPYMLTPEGWNIFKENINDTYSAQFLYFWKNRPLFAEKVGQAEVNKKTNLSWNMQAYSFTKNVGDKWLFDEAGFGKYLEYMKSMDVKNIEDVKFYALVDAYGKMGKWSSFADLIDARIKTKDDVDLMMLYNYPMRLEQKCTDVKVRKRAIAWVDLGIKRASANESTKMWLDSLVKLKESLSKPSSTKK